MSRSRRRGRRFARACTCPAAPCGSRAATRSTPTCPANPLQAGPLLVRDGTIVDGDAEGFAAGAGQFDSNITAGRYPRAALALCPSGRVLAVACDGRADQDAGLTLRELAGALVELGACAAINLDGGGLTSLGSAAASPMSARSKGSRSRAGARSRPRWCSGRAEPGFELPNAE